MRLLIGSVLVGWLVLVAAGRGHAGDFNDPGICQRCHESQTTKALAAGGHSALLDCLVCHEDRRPGVFGRGHRSVPTSCTGHHATPAATHPAPAKVLKPARLLRRCLSCHDVHGSPNARLIRPAIKAGGRFRPVDFHDTGGAVAGGFVDPSHPGRGLCEICHRDTAVYRRDGKGQPHFTDDCTICHQHAVGFEPIATDASCAVCHAVETAQLAGDSRHHDEFSGRCSACHAEVKAAPGPGHRAAAACVGCHAPGRVATHVPPGQPFPCTACHDAHGSGNAALVRDVIHTPAGEDRPLRFDNRSGRADGSFASASQPGSGLCEACHTQTDFYRADGSGAPHHVTACGVCHPHAAGFLPD